LAAESRNPIPHTKIYNGIITNGNNKIYGEKCDLVNNITITNAPIEKIKSISELVTFDNVKIYLGTYIFFIKELLSKTEYIDICVDEFMKSNKVCPANRYTG
jgi:hypothetical protein